MIILLQVLLILYAIWGAKAVGIKTDEFGMIPSELEKAAQSGKGKYIYLIPNFQTQQALPCH